MSYTDFFKKKAKELLSQFEKSPTTTSPRILTHLKSADGFGLMKSQHVIAKESGFNSWDELSKASDNELRVAKIIYQHPYIAKGVNTTAAELIGDSDKIIKIANWFGKHIKEPENSRDYLWYHTGTGKDAFSRLFAKEKNPNWNGEFDPDAYQYTNSEDLAIAALMLGFKIRPIDNGKYGRYEIRTSRKSWVDAWRKYPVMDRESQISDDKRNNTTWWKNQKIARTIEIIKRKEKFRLEDILFEMDFTWSRQELALFLGKLARTEGYVKYRDPDGIWYQKLKS